MDTCQGGRSGRWRSAASEGRDYDPVIRYIDRFVAQTLQENSSVPPALACFYAVRDVPYALDGAHDAATLVVERRGDCLAKAELLHGAFVSLGLRSRLVRFRYLLPEAVPEVDLLPSRVDLHRAVQTCMGNRWLLVDPTHDPNLHGHLTVAEWDLENATAPAYEPLGPVLVEGVDDDAIAGDQTAIAAQVAACQPEDSKRWRRAYVAWLASQRAVAQA